MRWFWADLWLYASSLPRLQGYLNPSGKSLPYLTGPKAAGKYGTKPDNKSGGEAQNFSSENFDI